MRKFRVGLLFYALFDFALGYGGLLPMPLIQAASGQQIPPNPVITQQITMPLFTLNPAPATGATIAIGGNPGPQTIYYWVSANYLVGKAALAGPFPILNAPNPLSASNFVTINPTVPAGALTYDVLKTLTPTMPSGACACAVATAVAISAVTNDQSNSTSAYTVNPVNIAGLNMTLQNEVQNAGVSHLILRQNNNLVADLSVLSSGGGGSAYPSQVIQSGLIAEYRFTDGSGTTLTDFSGNNNNGTLGSGGNAPTWGAAPGFGLIGNGVSQVFVDLPAAVGPATVKTVQIFTSFQNASLYSLGVNKSPALLQTTNSDETVGFSNAFFANFSWQAIGAWGNNQLARYTRASLVGTGLVSISMTNPDTYYLGSTALVANASNNLFNSGTGTFRFFSGFTGFNAYYFPGTIYYAVFYNRALNAGEIAQNYLFIQGAMNNRGVQVSNADTFTTSSRLTAEGDSITSGNAGGFTPWVSDITLNGTWSIVASAQSGQTMATIQQSGNVADGPYFAVNGGPNVVSIWAGTNDGDQTGQTQITNMSSYALQRKQQGYKVVAATMMSRTAADTHKNNLNALIRGTWATFADGLVDIASDPLVGADGASANTTYFNADGIHPLTPTASNQNAFYFQRSINRLYGNQDFSTAATYTTTAPAATAITAASESGSTATYTMASNPFVAGQLVTATGITPSGYNTTGVGCLALTATATQITCLLPTSGLGAGTVFGTMSAPVQKDVDKYAILAGAATSPNFTLQTCQGYTGQNIYLKNANTTSPWVLTPYGSETIDGAATLTMPAASSGNNPVVILQSVLVSAAAAGCNWKRLQ